MRRQELSQVLVLIRHKVAEIILCQVIFIILNNSVWNSLIK